MSEELPSFVLEKIRTICERSEFSEEEIKKDYLEIFQNPFIQQDPQFTSDEERHRYASAVLWTRYVSRPPVAEFEIIPIGFDGKRISRAGNPTSTIFVLSKEKNGVKLRRVSCPREVATLYRDVTLFAKYNVKLGQFRGGGDFIADNRTKFEHPILLRLKPNEIMEKFGPKLGIKRVTVKEAEKFPSVKRSDGYTDLTDWRVVRGIIVREARGTRDDETEWAMYIISDESVNAEPTVAPDGTIIQPGMPVWHPPEMHVYRVESECDFYGTIVLNEEGRPRMNCYLILPVHAQKIAGTEE